MRAAVLVTTLLVGACAPATPRVVAQSAGGHRFHDYPDPTPTTVATTTTVAPTTTTTVTVVRAEPNHASRGTVRAGLDWLALRVCESGDNYADRDNATYRGAYQAERGTWNGYWIRHDRPDLVGLDPADATPDDQDAFAYGLYAERGAQPWPVCGRRLFG